MVDAGFDRVHVTYRFPLTAGEDPKARAREMAREQTVEVPEGCFPPEFEGAVVAEVAGVERVGEGVVEVRLTYSREVAGGGVPQLLNLLLGNVSMFERVRVVDIGWPDWVGEIAAGPAFGVDGVRRLTGVFGRPLLATAVKPLGHTVEELARRCREFVLGGLDIVKDDHSLADQEWAPFAERVARCQEAVAKAGGEAGSEALYVPHLSGPFEELPWRVERLRALGCRAVMVHPAILGWDVVRWLAAESGLAVFTHPTFSGPLWAVPDTGIAPEILLGDLLRLLGSDVVVYPNAAGRFPITLQEVNAIAARLRRPWEGIRPALPMLGGGIDLERVGEWASRFGPDTVLLVGSSLYAQGDLRAASSRLRQAIETRSIGRHSS
ncbi:MAG: RuBisCO large subunit C-terminal-like domain-containing protein [Thermoanaerobaculia bacterium]